MTSDTREKIAREFDLHADDVRRDYSAKTEVADSDWRAARVLALIDEERGEPVAWGVFGRLVAPGRVMCLQRVFMCEEDARQHVKDHDPSIFEMKAVSLYASSTPTTEDA